MGLQTTSSMKIKLAFRPGHTLSSETSNREYDRVILALPKRAVENIARRSDVFQEPEIFNLLDSAFGFPMVKMFVVVKSRWWEEDNRANRYATRVPTRELHYWKGLTPNSKQGLIMAYTDRPASSFWANYVPPGDQLDVRRSSEMPLPPTLERRLKRKVVQYINENDVPDITSDDIAWYGIRDWGREPYKGANHAWRPERKYWVVMRRLAEIPAVDQGTGAPRVHVCGEAYSDYHGFMEGSLRSAVYVLHRILDEIDGKSEPLPWLPAEKPGADGKELCVEEKYLEALRKWAHRLDEIDHNAPYLCEE
jgi:monoamine oxidase